MTRFLTACPSSPTLSSTWWTRPAKWRGFERRHPWPGPRQNGAAPGRPNRPGASADFERRQNLCAHRVEQDWDLIARFGRRLADAGELGGRELEATLTSASWTGLHAAAGRHDRHGRAHRGHVGLHWRLIEAQAEGKYCSGCAFDGFFVAGRAGADPTLVHGREPRGIGSTSSREVSRWRTRPGSRRMGSARSAAGPGPAPCAFRRALSLN